MGSGSFNCPLFSAWWHFKVLFPNRRMDKYSNWLMCWSRAIFTLQHLPLSFQKKVQQFLGSPPTEDLIYPHACMHCLGSQEHVDLFAGCRCRSQCEAVGGWGLGDTAACRPFSKSDSSPQAEAMPRLYHILKAWCFRSHLSQESCQGWPLQGGLTQIVTSFRPGKPL